MKYIYKITSPSGKIYIGQSTVSIEKKKKWYEKQHAINSNRPIINAIQKYGWNNMIFELIEDCNHLSKEELNLKEQSWIKFFNSIDEGYNVTIGGDGIDSEAAKILAKRHYANMSDEKKRKRSLNCSAGQIKRFMNAPESQDTRSKKSKAHKGIYKIISPNGEEFITYDGLKDFANQIENQYNITYWQLYDAYRKNYKKITTIRKRKDSNNWQVIRLDEPNPTRNSKRLDNGEKN